jgi:hypothetical protein
MKNNIINVVKMKGLITGETIIISKTVPSLSPTRPQTQLNKPTQLFMGGTTRVK